MAMPFADRADAGRQLGARVATLGLVNPLVLGIARGGVIVAAEVAAVLGAELGVTIARKLGAPHNPELGIGAVTPDGTVVVDEAIAAGAGATPAHIEREVARETAEARRRLAAFDGHLVTDVRGRTVVLVDDGLATGVTARAALRALRAAGASRIVLAVPCASPRTLVELRREVDDLVVVIADEDFYATGQYYRDFRPVGDAKVREALTAPHPSPDGT